MAEQYEILIKAIIIVIIAVSVGYLIKRKMQL